MEYLNEEEVKKCRNEFHNIMVALHAKFNKRDWAFTHKLVGSGDKNLILVGNEGFDLDYHIILKRHPNNLSAKEIKMIFKDNLDEILDDYDMRYCEDSTHVLTTKHIDDDDNLIYSYDIAITIIGVGTLILKNDKSNFTDSDYHFVQVQKSKGFYEKFENVRDDIRWEELRKIYKGKKERQQNLNKDNRKISFSLLIESVNQVLQKFPL